MTTLIMCVFITLTPVPGKVSPELNRILSRTSPEEQIIVIVHMNTEYPHEWPANLDAAGRGTVMREIAASSQQGIVDFISNLSSGNAVMGGRYWIFNGFHLKATRNVIEALARRDDVWYVSENRIVK